MNMVSNIHNIFFRIVVILIYYLVNFQLKLLAKEICIVVSMADIQDVHMAINVNVLIFEYQIKSLGRLLLGPEQTTISFIGNNDSR